MKSAGEVIAALGGDPATGMCRCPAHRDKTPSLHVSSAANGKPLFHCHARCSQQEVITALRQRGLWPGKGNGGSTVSQPAKEKEDTWWLAHDIIRSACRWEKDDHLRYLKGRGIELAPPNLITLPAKESRRLTGRNFPAMIAPISDGTRLTGAHVTWLTRDFSDKVASKKPRKIYGHFKGSYVQLSDEIDPDGPLIVGEGIETTLSAMMLADSPGVAALSTAGLKAFRPPPCSEIIIAADHDESGAGLAAAREAATRLKYEGKRVRIVMPRTVGLDWNAVHTKRGIDKARAQWVRAYADQLEEDDDEQLLSLDEERFMNLTFPKCELLLGPWLPKPGVAMIYAPRGEGKTWFALAVAKAIANKEDFCGWKVSDYGRVLYVDGELPGARLQERLDRFDRSPTGMFHVLCRDRFHLKQKVMPDLMTEDGRKVIDRHIEAIKPALIVLDSLSTLVRSGVENDAESWQVIQDWLQSHRWRGRTVLFVHHAGKSGQQRGTSKREDVLDTIIALSQRRIDEETEESVFELKFDKHRDFFGKDTEPLLLKLAMQNGKAVWTHELIRSERDQHIVEMLEQGLTQTQIAKELELSKGRVTQIVHKLQKDNVIKGPWKKKSSRRDDDAV